MATSVGRSGKLYAFHRRDVHGRNPSRCNVTSVRVPTNPICKLSCGSSSKYFSLKPTSAVSLNVNSRCDLSSFRGMGLVPSRDTSARIRVLPWYPTMTPFVRRASDSTGVPCSARTTGKPKWWLRTLACIPYLMPLHVLSLCAHNVAEHIPLMTGLEVLANPLTGTELPRWFPAAYFCAAYYGVAGNGRRPRFLRLHVLMSMLFDTALQIAVISSGWFPYARYWRRPFWTAVGVASYFAIFECVRHALQGTYADIPLFTDAARMHINIKF